MDPELRKRPAGNEGARDSHDEVAREAKACTLDDLACEPAGGDADNQYNEKAFARYVHFYALVLGLPAAAATQFEFNSRRIGGAPASDFSVAGIWLSTDSNGND